MGKIETIINTQLNRYPDVKKVIKRVYQLGMYAISPRIKSEGIIKRVSPDDGAEYFFGYYDKSPWDMTDRYMLCIKARYTTKDVAPAEAAELIIIDTETNDIRILGKTKAWNVQQGCMLQWLGPDYKTSVIYNDFRDGKFCSVIQNINTKTERVLPMPVYTVSSDGKTALTLDFTRLHRLRKGYGYSNMEEITKDQKIPDSTCIWRIDIESGDVSSLLKYTDFTAFEPRPEMKNAEHKVNHIMLSPDGKRFMVLHRWFNGQCKYTRLVTCNIDGTEMYNLNDDDMVSHCCWKNDNEILAYENKKVSGLGYYLMKDKTLEYTHLWTDMCSDGHPSYSPDGRLVVTDTYPDRARIASVKVMNGEKIMVVARVFAPFKYDNDNRCDLHPRWSRKGDMICVDSVFEGHRGLYYVRVDNLGE